MLLPWEAILKNLWTSDSAQQIWPIMESEERQYIWFDAYMQLLLNV